jgi:hypothetical protein
MLNQQHSNHSILTSTVQRGAANKVAWGTRYSYSLEHPVAVAVPLVLLPPAHYAVFEHVTAAAVGVHEHRLRLQDTPED